MKPQYIETNTTLSELKALDDMLSEIRIKREKLIHQMFDVLYEFLSNSEITLDLNVPEKYRDDIHVYELKGTFNLEETHERNKTGMILKKRTIIFENESDISLKIVYDFVHKECECNDADSGEIALRFLVEVLEPHINEYNLLSMIEE